MHYELDLSIKVRVHAFEKLAKYYIHDLKHLKKEKQKEKIKEMSKKTTKFTIRLISPKLSQINLEQLK